MLMIWGPAPHCMHDIVRSRASLGIGRTGHGPCSIVDLVPPQAGDGGQKKIESHAGDI